MWRCTPLVLVGVSSLAVAEPVKLTGLTEGQWDSTIKIELSSVPFAMPPILTSSCITKKEAVPLTAQPGQDCKVRGPKITGDTVEWTVLCKDASGGPDLSGAGKLTYKGDTYSGTLQLTASGQAGVTLTYTLTGKRTGDCKKP
jgi:hypothetical protein